MNWRDGYQNRLANPLQDDIARHPSILRVGYATSRHAERKRERSLTLGRVTAKCLRVMLDATLSTASYYSYNSSDTEAAVSVIGENGS